MLSAVAVFLVFGTSLGAAEKSTELVWHPLEEAMKLAQAQKKPLYVFLYSSFCGWCRRFERNTLNNEDVKKLLSEKFILTKLNSSSTKRQKFKGKLVSERRLCAMFAVRGVPTSAFMEFQDTVGTIIAKVPGYIPPDKFKLLLKYIGDKWYKDMTYEEFIRSEEILRKGKR